MFMPCFSSFQKHPRMIERVTAERFVSEMPYLGLYLTKASTDTSTSRPGHFACTHNMAIGYSVVVC